MAMTDKFSEITKFVQACIFSYLKESRNSTNSKNVKIITTEQQLDKPKL